LPAGLEGIEVLCPARASVNFRHCPQPDALNSPGVVVHPGHNGLLNSIDPECQVAIVPTCGRRSLPVQFNTVWRIAYGEPRAVCKARSVIHEACSDLIVIIILTQLYLQHRCPRGITAVEDEMGIISSHSDRIRIEVEARPVA